MPGIHSQNNLATWLVKHSTISFRPKIFPSNFYLRHVKVQGRYQILLLLNTIFHESKGILSMNSLNLMYSIAFTLDYKTTLSSTYTLYLYLVSHYEISYCCKLCWIEYYFSHSCCV